MEMALCFDNFLDFGILTVKFSQLALLVPFLSSLSQLHH
jgi:hypothetical protein